MERLTKRQLITELRSRPGLIPYTIDKETFQLTWVDYERYHFYEGFAWHSHKRFAGLKSRTSAPTYFATEFDVLEANELLTENLYPSAFIFHASRSGSTLLAKCFARSRKNLVLSEYPAHNRVLLALTENGTRPIGSNPVNSRLFRNLVLATARKRIESHRHNIVKFNAYHIHFYDFIRSVFPDVPAIFLFRQPSEILASILNNKMSWLDNPNSIIRECLTGIHQKDYERLENSQYLIDCISNLFSAALNVDDTLGFVNLDQLDRQFFKRIVEAFGLSFDGKDIAAMQSQFNYYSKSENKLVRYAEPQSNGALEESEKLTHLDSAAADELYQMLESRILVGKSSNE